MGKRSKQINSYKYPDDEFDKAKNLPMGVHRPPRTVKSFLLPIIISIIAGAAIAVAIFAFVYQGTLFGGPNVSGDNKDDSSTVSYSTESPSASASSSATSTPSPSATPTPTPTSTPSLASSVSVENASGVTGAAAGAKTALDNAGYTDVTANNFTGATPPAENTIYYKTDADKATATAVATLLGYKDIVILPDLTTSISVVLVNP
jgi:cytoskeletal protein RodZ